MQLGASKLNIMPLMSSFSINEVTNRDACAKRVNPLLVFKTFKDPKCLHLNCSFLFSIGPFSPFM